MTTADQPGLDKDPRIFGTLARERRAYLGRYARVLRPGTIGAGDPIVCLGIGEAVDLDLFAFYRDRIQGADGRTPRTSGRAAGRRAS
jgi:hypothetical protein